MSSDARTPRISITRSRALLALAAACVLGAGLLVTVALWPGPDPDAAVLEVEDAVASSVPSTVPTFAEEAEPTSDEPSDRTLDTTEPTRAVSPLVPLLGEAGSAIPPRIEPRLQPVHLTIDRMSIDDPVRPVGLEADGELEVPGPDEIGWYRYGGAPGYPGATVLAAHVSWNGEYGPFLRLGEVEPGDRVTVGLDDGSERSYEVIERTMYAKDGLPRARIWRSTGDETLVLITCGGDFDPGVRRYRQNIVVYAVPVDPGS